MAQPYLGEIRMFAGNFAPAGWAFCAGQPVAISQNESLFSLIGTTYGGDGQTTFALPDLRGRVPVHQGNGLTLAQTGGAEDVTLTTQQLPVHSHALLAAQSQGTANAPAGNVLASSPSISLYLQDAAPSAMAPNSLGPTGGSQPHTNLQPYLCVNFIISLFGLFPSQS